MAAADELFKEFGEAFGRLFDHRPVIQGEISFFQHEFEENRGKQEEIHLQKSWDYGREINEKLIPQIIEQLQTNFPRFHTSVSETVGLSQKVLEKEQKLEKSEWLKQRKIQRFQHWNSFLEQMTARVSDIDKEFKNEVAMIDTHYKELEEKLKITDRTEKNLTCSEKQSAVQNKDNPDFVQETTSKNIQNIENVNYEHQDH